MTIPGSVHNLVVITGALHFRHDGRIYAYGPYAREIDIWCDLFPHVTIAAPWKIGPPPGDCLPLGRDNISLHLVNDSGGTTIRAKVAQLIALPRIVWQLCSAMKKADAIHVRFPGNVSLLSVILAPLFSSKLFAKYAGQWNPNGRDKWTTRLQRWLLRSPWWRGPVTVYGKWPDEPSHIIPFFTSIMTAAHLERARTAASQPRPTDPFRVLFVGRLSRAKNADVVIKAVSALRREGVLVDCEIVGQGAARATLEALVGQLDVGNAVKFVGGVPFDRVFDYYVRANVLVLVSETEGWPKAIAEAMACGVVCIGSNRGLIPKMLAAGRGFVVPPRDVDALTKILRQLIRDQDLREQTAQRAAAWGQQYSLESLREAFRRLLTDHWGGGVNPRTDHSSTEDPQPTANRHEASYSGS